MNIRRMLSTLLITTTAFTFVACGGSDDSSTDKAPIPREDFNLVYANPKEYEGREVEFYGRIFTDVEKDKDGTYMQVYSNENGTDNNVLVGINDPNLDVKNGDIINVKGIVKGEEKGSNAFGAELRLPVVLANTVEVTDYGTAFAPALKTIEINEEQNQNGYKLTLKKVEIAKNETRAYVKVENTTSDKVTFQNFNSVLTQGSNQYEQNDNWDADYPEISGDILQGIIKEGVVTFKPLDVNGGNFKMIFEGGSDNYSLDFKPFTFEIMLD